MQKKTFGRADPLWREPKADEVDFTWTVPESILALLIGVGAIFMIVLAMVLS